MIILIGGSSHVGKTLAAQKLLEKLNYPYISLDHLKMGFIRTGKTELTVEDDYEMRYFLFPFAAEMIKTAIENKQNMIMEGCYIPGQWRDYFEEEYLKDIRCVFIVMSEEYIRRHFSDITGYADVIEKRLCDEPDMERLIMCSKNFKADCEKYGIDCIEIDGEYDIDEIVEKIIS
ncbi:MAG: adenylate kinase [Clostridia bacterium]|nr:adenylate kinase [Clostridia bacterium]